MAQPGSRATSPGCVSPRRRDRATGWTACQSSAFRAVLFKGQRGRARKSDAGAGRSVNVRAFAGERHSSRAARRLLCSRPRPACPSKNHENVMHSRTTGRRAEPDVPSRSTARTCDDGTAGTSCGQFAFRGRPRRVASAGPEFMSSRCYRRPSSASGSTMTGSAGSRSSPPAVDSSKPCISTGFWKRPALPVEKRMA